ATRVCRLATIPDAANGSARAHVCFTAVRDGTRTRSPGNAVRHTTITDSSCPIWAIVAIVNTATIPLRAGDPNNTTHDAAICAAAHPVSRIKTVGTHRGCDRNAPPKHPYVAPATPSSAATRSP